MAQENITQILQDLSAGDRRAADRLFPFVYDELRRLAAAYFSRERRDHTLQPTALVHEAYLRLIDQKSVEWQNRAHFFGVAANMMRRILVDHARAKATEKHGGSRTRITLDKSVSFQQKNDVDLVAIDEALTILAELDETQSQIVELRFFGGLTIEETAEVLKISPATVKREWAMAKAWLYDRLKSES
jgi:RNA polymerase sigma factor (TIGR02999 family)